MRAGSLCFCRTIGTLALATCSKAAPDYIHLTRPFIIRQVRRLPHLLPLLQCSLAPCSIRCVRASPKNATVPYTLYVTKRRQDSSKLCFYMSIDADPTISTMKKEERKHRQQKQISKCAYKCWSEMTSGTRGIMPRHAEMLYPQLLPPKPQSPCSSFPICSCSICAYKPRVLLAKDKTNENASRDSAPLCSSLVHKPFQAESLTRVTAFTKIA